jgi:hypothetical protein
MCKITNFFKKYKNIIIPSIIGLIIKNSDSIWVSISDFAKNTLI